MRSGAARRCAATAATAKTCMKPPRRASRAYFCGTSHAVSCNARARANVAGQRGAASQRRATVRCYIAATTQTCEKPPPRASSANLCGTSHAVSCNARARARGLRRARGGRYRWRGGIDGDSAVSQIALWFQGVMILGALLMCPVLSTIALISCT